MVVGVDMLAERQRRARLPLHFVRLSRRRRRLCDWKLFMALVRCCGIVAVGALVRVGLWERDGQRRAVVGHGVCNRANKILAPTDEVVFMHRSR